MQTAKFADIEQVGIISRARGAFAKKNQIDKVNIINTAIDNALAETRSIRLTAKQADAIIEIIRAFGYSEEA